MYVLYTWKLSKFSPLATHSHWLNLYHTNILSCVNDCTKDMVTLIALAKIYSTNSYFNTKVAGLGEIFVQRKFPRTWYPVRCILHLHVCLCIMYYIMACVISGWRDWSSLHKWWDFTPQISLPTLMDVIFKLHKCGFETCAVVCDGASSNLVMIKELTGAERKAFGYVLN